MGLLARYEAALAECDRLEQQLEASRERRALIRKRIEDALETSDLIADAAKPLPNDQPARE